MLEFFVSGILVGNKSDLAARREVQASVAQEWAQSRGMEYHETSAVSVSQYGCCEWSASNGHHGPCPHVCLAEGEGELRRAAPQFGPDLPLSLPGAPQRHPEPEPRLDLITYRLSLKTLCSFVPCVIFWYDWIKNVFSAVCCRLVSYLLVQSTDGGLCSPSDGQVIIKITIRFLHLLCTDVFSWFSKAQAHLYLLPPTFPFFYVFL